MKTKTAIKTRNSKTKRLAGASVEWERSFAMAHRTKYHDEAAALMAQIAYADVLPDYFKLPKKLDADGQAKATKLKELVADHATRAAKMKAKFLQRISQPANSDKPHVASLLRAWADVIEGVSSDWGKDAQFFVAQVECAHAFGLPEPTVAELLRDWQENQKQNRNSTASELTHEQVIRCLKYAGYNYNGDRTPRWTPTAHS